MPAASCNELFGLGSHSEDANLEVWHPMQDDAADTVVDDASSNGNDGTLIAVAGNTEDATDTGPNSVFTKSLKTIFADDRITYPKLFSNVSAFTVLFRCKLVTSASQDIAGNWQSGPDSGGATHWLIRNTNAQSYIRNAAGSATYGGATAGATMGTSAWHAVSLTADGSNMRSAVDGSYGSDLSAAANYIPSGGTIWDWADGHNSGAFNGLLCDGSVFSRALSSAEENQWRDSFEPVVLSGSDTITGTETEGETLSASAEATWGLPAPFSAGTNGTITYSYQWTRSDDGTGTGEVNISGATSATYVSVSADVGKHLARLRYASNDGGQDPAEVAHSNYTGAIAGSGGTPAQQPATFFGCAL